MENSIKIKEWENQFQHIRRIELNEQYKIRGLPGKGGLGSLRKKEALSTDATRFVFLRLISVAWGR